MTVTSSSQDNKAPDKLSALASNRRNWLIVAGIVVVAVVVAVVLVAAGSSSKTSSTVGADGRPIVIMSPNPGEGRYHNGQVITVSIGANKYFTRYLRVIVIECADPGGQVDALPVSDTACDGNSVQSGSLLVTKNGSFSVRYPVYSLPNTLLGEAWDNEPVCNETHACVLYVGFDPNDFSQPKVFSAPFTIVPGDVPERLPS
ncbi:MAG: hypothetical protein ABSB09_11270 [Acidimicrobiales bacterium]